jgi:hypothetical protein
MLYIVSHFPRDLYGEYCEPNIFFVELSEHEYKEVRERIEKFKLNPIVHCRIGIVKLEVDPTEDMLDFISSLGNELLAYRP